MADTGPPYPPGPQPGSNAIGSFTIGISPLGTIVPFDYWTTVLSQYANSPTLIQLIDNFDQYVDQTANFESFYDNIWNITTARGYGLDIWGRIVGIVRTLNISVGEWFGFNEQAALGQVGTFNQAAFYSGQSITTNYVLTDDSFRQLILAKAYANICNGSIPAINQLLRNLFPGRGNIYCTDGLNMTMTITAEFPLTSVEVAIITQSGVMPRPTGVAQTLVQA